MRRKEKKMINLALSLALAALRCGLWKEIDMFGRIWRTWICRCTHWIEKSNQHLSMLSPSSDAAVMDISGFYGVGNVIDQHQDLRLDIDEMSYEELLALEEQIGDVKTGLTEEFIIKNLKTSVHNSQTTMLPSDALSRFSQEAEACIVCQVDYEEDEIIGTLDCGHNYHGECIKQWLLVKNLCPVCKKTGLATVNSEG